MTAVQDGRATPGVVGRRVPKVDAIAKVTGTSRFADDLTLPGMLYARLVRGTEAHAEVVRVGAAAALGLPETVAVLSSDNLVAQLGPLPSYDPACHDFERQDPFSPEPGDAHLFSGVVRYAGEPVAAVAATSDAAARRAAACWRSPTGACRRFSMWSGPGTRGRRSCTPTRLATWPRASSCAPATWRARCGPRPR